MLSWQITTSPTDTDAALIANGVVAYGRAQAVGGKAQPLACLVRDGGQLVAGATGRTEFARLFVAYLWVAEDRRGQGLGSMVLSRLEDQARATGCTSALLETLSDRTAGLYQRLGYRLVASVPNYVGGFSKSILIKPLAD